MKLDTAKRTRVFDLTVPSEADLVGPSIRRCKELLREMDEGELRNTSLILRELLNNAMVHGNRSEPDREVRCHVHWYEDGRVRISVEDEGDGFDWRSLRTELPEDPRRLARRGYVIVHALSDELEFNEKGNKVTVVISPQPGLLPS